MPLGNQFKNTYYTDPKTGETKFYTAGSDGKVYTSTDEANTKALNEMNGRQIDGYQGMLFDPHWGTGSKKDPSIPEEERRGRINRALQIDTPAAYEQNRRRGGQYSDISKNQSESDRKLIGDTAFNTDIPTHMFSENPTGLQNPQNIDVAVALQKERVSEGGHYSGHSSYPAIRLNRYQHKILLGRKPIVEQETFSPGEPIPNPNMGQTIKQIREAQNSLEWDDKKNLYGKYGEGIDEVTRKVGFTDGSGREFKTVKGYKSPRGTTHYGFSGPYFVPKELDMEQFMRPENEEERNRSNGFYWSDPNRERITFDHEKFAAHPDVHPANFKGLTEGQDGKYDSLADGANLYPGHSKGGDDFVAQNFTVKGNRFHTRWAKKSEGVTTTGGERIWGKEESISGHAVVHELGHSLDPNVRDTTISNRNGDPVKEAIADGFADRFHNYRGFHVSALDPTTNEDTLNRRSQDIQVGHGYTSRHCGDHMVNQALYAAVRTHTAMGDRNYADFSKRGQLASVGGTEYKDGNKLLLGELHTKHPHVRAMLGKLGLGMVGQDAEKFYRSHVTDASRAPEPPQSEQPTLF